jgi:CRP-like cAMP-binding protein
MTLRPTAGDLQIIARIAVFRGLKPETVQHIIAPATAVTLEAHSVLFRQGDPATAFFIVIDGWIKLNRINVSGEETVIHILTKGDNFAEAVAFTGVRFPATAEAVTDARVVRSCRARCACSSKRRSEASSAGHRRKIGDPFATRDDA